MGYHCRNFLLRVLADFGSNDGVIQLNGNLITFEDLALLWKHPGWELLVLFFTMLLRFSF